MTASVFVPRRLTRLFASDTRNVARDPTLLFAILFSLAPALAGFLFRDAIDGVMESTLGISDFFAMIVPMVICIPAVMIGWVTGFLFLEDRDDGPLLALDVTPVGKRGFMTYRIAVTAAITFAITLYGAALLLPEGGMALALVLALMIALDAVAVALILPALARNKVEGLALTKVNNLLSFFALLPLVPLPWRLLGSFIPTYWIGEIILNTDPFPSSGFVIASLIGIGLHVLMVVLFYRLQSRRAG